MTKSKVICTATKTLSMTDILLLLLLLLNRTRSTKRQNKTEERTEQSTCTQIAWNEWHIRPYNFNYINYTFFSLAPVSSKLALLRPIVIALRFCWLNRHHDVVTTCSSFIPVSIIIFPHLGSSTVLFCCPLLQTLLFWYSKFGCPLCTNLTRFRAINVV